jgi:hypothetical protein
MLETAGDPLSRACCSFSCSPEAFCACERIAVIPGSSTSGVDRLTDEPSITQRRHEAANVGRIEINRRIDFLDDRRLPAIQRIKDQNISTTSTCTCPPCSSC